MRQLTIAPAATVRATIAAHVLGDQAADEVGEIRLRPHQRAAVSQLLRMIERHRGALLADDVGLGKTFVALAIAGRTPPACVVGPAAVRDHWLTSAARAGVPIVFVSVESLSRGGGPESDVAFVIIDEAHHLRNAATRRFHAASALCRDARVLLLSATPIQNRLDDLRVVLSLFLGAHAFALDLPELTRHVLRRAAGDVAAAGDAVLPRVEPPRWLPRVNDVDCLDALLALPPPVPPWDGGDGGVLVTLTLVRQWASSRAALAGALRRRLARGLAMLDVLGAGRVPSRAELQGWCYADGSQQLFLAGLLDACNDGAERLREPVARHVSAVRALIAALARTPDPDLERARILGELARARHGDRVVAFSEYAETVGALFRLLVPTGRVAMLSHRGGRIASGPISRRELLDRFAAGAARRLAPRDRIDLLLTTDALSEGVNLSDANVVVHLDLSWNPARLEQRVGRVRRLGSERSSVAVHLFAPPAPSEKLLAAERRLRVKRAVAGRALGVAGSILPGPFALDPSPAPAVSHARITAIVGAWRGAGTSRVPVVGAVASAASGALICARVAGIARLLVCGGNAISADPECVARFCAEACGRDVTVDGTRADTVSELVQRWLARQAVSRVIDAASLRVARSRRVVLERVASIARRTPRHALPSVGHLMQEARRAASLVLSDGAERVLGKLAGSPLDDEAWLHAMREFVGCHAPREAPSDGLIAVLLLSPEECGR